ncbi:sortase domain-bontaining protein [Nocardioides sp. NPDC087217]|uniref:class F sortase n=1 Tax=Nocardioides sp. NPDC087217 TaxID=3364335 RepID=UPI003800A0F1
MTAPAGYKIRQYCVKAGAAPAGGGPVYVTVDPPRQSVTITHPTGKAVSHWSIEYASCTTTPVEPDESPDPEPTETDPTETDPTETDPTETDPTPDASPDTPDETGDTGGPESPGETGTGGMESPGGTGGGTGGSGASDREATTPDAEGAESAGPGGVRVPAPEVSPPSAATDLPARTLCRVNAGLVEAASLGGSRSDGSGWVLGGAGILAGVLLLGAVLVGLRAGRPSRVRSAPEPSETMHAPRLPRRSPRGKTVASLVTMTILLATAGPDSLVWRLTEGATPGGGARAGGLASAEEPFGGTVRTHAAANAGGLAGVGTDSRPGRQQQGAVPLQLMAPSIGVDAPVVPVGLVENTLTPPAEASAVGWWSGGARPGAAHGAMVLVGHTVLDGMGVFDDLPELTEGATLIVSTQDRAVRYTVTTVRTLSRAAFARWAPALSDSGGAARLVLVTCTDWDGSRYLSNAVVVARPSRDPSVG